MLDSKNIFKKYWKYPVEAVGRGEDDLFMDEDPATLEDISLCVGRLYGEVSLPGELVHFRFRSAHQLGQVGGAHAALKSKI